MTFRRPGHLLILLALLLGASLTAGPARALPASVLERTELFAICEGRFRAMAVWQRGIRAPAQHSEARRDAFGSLLEATLPLAMDTGMDRKAPKRWQATGWTEVAYLLTDSHHRDDGRQARRAARQLDTRLKACEAALLPEG